MLIPAMVMIRETMAYGGSRQEAPGGSVSNPSLRDLPCWKNSRPLPLRGTHFIRSDFCTLPRRKDVDSDDGHSLVASTPALRSWLDLDPNDDPLSESELEAVYGNNEQSEVAYSIAGATGAITHKSSKSAALSKSVAQLKLRRNSQAEKIVLCRDQDYRNQHVSNSFPKLVLAASPPSQYDIGAFSGPSGNESQDGVVEDAVSPETHILSHWIEQQLSLTSLRKRLKQHKSQRFRKIRRTGHALQKAGVEIQRGDGFEHCERKLARRPVVKGTLKYQRPFMLKFGALRLRSGPLPEVKFISHSPVLDLEAHDDHATSQCDDEQVTREVIHNPSIHEKQNFSSDQPVLSERVLAQLSAISAPPRACSMSDDSDEDEDHEFHVLEDDDDADDGDDDDQPRGPHPTAITRDGQPLISDEEGVSTSSSQLICRKRPMFAEWASIVQHETVIEPPQSPMETAVTFDFRVTKRTQLGEFDEVIDDDCEPGEGPWINDRETTSSNPSEKARSEATTRQLRSIRKHSVSGLQETDTRLEDTAANTHRNSIVTPEESCYFATTSEMPRVADTSTLRTIREQPRHVISSYFPRSDVHVYDSESAVPETSPRIRYQTGSYQANVSEKTFGGPMTSAERRLPKNLKSLTTSVSRDHGTLSQSIKRRPTLPFRSPANMTPVER